MRYCDLGVGHRLCQVDTDTLGDDTESDDAANDIDDSEYADNGQNQPDAEEDSQCSDSESEEDETEGESETEDDEDERSDGYGSDECIYDDE